MTMKSRFEMLLRISQKWEPLATFGSLAFGIIAFFIAYTALYLQYSDIKASQEDTMKQISALQKIAQNVSDQQISSMKQEARKVANVFFDRVDSQQYRDKVEEIVKITETDPDKVAYQFRQMADFIQQPFVSVASCSRPDCDDEELYRLINSTGDSICKIQDSTVKILVNNLHKMMNNNGFDWTYAKAISYTRAANNIKKAFCKCQAAGYSSQFMKEYCDI